MRTYRPGDWVEVGKQTALSWIASGQARAVQPVKMALGSGSGVVLTRDHQGAQATLDKFVVPYCIADPRLEWARTLVWDPAVKFRWELAPVAFKFLDTWEIAAPLLSYETLARDLGTEEEREATQSIIRDLRVPVYDTSLMFVRRNRTTRQLFDRWQEERSSGSDERLRFLRALYQTRPLVLALPVGWVQRG